MVVVVTGKHELSILENPLHILLFVGGELALLGKGTHSAEALFDLCIKLCLGRVIYCFFVDGFDAGDVVFVEIVGEHRVGLTEVLSCIFEGTVFGN